jgi:hypothetical protein
MNRAPTGHKFAAAQSGFMSRTRYSKVPITGWHYATSQKFAGSNPDEVIEFFQLT